MVVKFVILVSLAAASSAGILPAPRVTPVYSSPYAAPIAPVYAKTVAAPETYDPHPQYNFNYEINDVHTGDVKSQHEIRDGDMVKGAYSFIESDGSRRVVEYTSDPDHGFNAVVHREEGASHPTGPAAAPVYAKVAAAPVYPAPVAKIVAPLYSAPATYAGYSSHGYYH